MMTPRERFKAIMNFEEPDQVPWIENMDIEPLIKWLGTHIPAKEVMVPNHGCCFEQAFPAFVGSSPNDIKTFDTHSHFGFTPVAGIIAPVDLCPIPRFPTERVEETEDYIEEKVNTGVTVRLSKKAPHPMYTMPMFKDWPVQGRESWEEYKKRLNPLDDRRLPKDWNPEYYKEKFKNFECGAAMLNVNGFYGFGAQLMGIDRFNKSFYKNRKLIEDMIQYWKFFIKEATRPVLEVAGDYLDAVYFWEDMAERNGPFISPKLYEDIFLPHYKDLIDFFNQKNVKHVMVDTDGNFEPLIDLMIEAGIDGLWPLETAAGMNARKIRKEYGDQIWVGGNIDKEKVKAGGEKMRKEVNKKIETAKELGGYAVGLDHLVPGDISYNKFKEYSEYVKKNV